MGDVDDWPALDLDDFRFHFADNDRRRLPVDHWSELLFQSTWWQDADRARTIWRLDELSGQQCALIRHFVAMSEDETGTRLAWEMGSVPEPQGFQASVDLARADLELTTMVSKRGWILRTELVVSLQRRMRGLPAVEGTCFCGYPVVEDWDHSACYAGMEIA